ncbi:MAG TPA: hypothetical protein VF244_03915, partial [Acidimicrobiales bacterium]
ETSVGDWIASLGVSSLVRSTSFAMSGTASLATTAVGGGTPAVITLNTWTLIDPLAFYEVKARFRAGSTGTPLTMAVDWYDYDFNLIGSETSASVTDTNAAWTTLTQQFQAPLGARRYKLRVIFTNPGASTVHYMDLVEFEPVIRDYFVPRLANSAVVNPIRYRVTSGHALSFDATTGAVAEYVLGTSLTVMPTALVGDCNTHLKHPYVPALSVLIEDNANLESSSAEDMAILGASGREDWAVFRGTVRMEQGRLGLQVIGDANWLALETLRKAQVPLLLQTSYGDTLLEQMWVVLGPERSVVRMTVPRQNLLAYRRVSIGFTQVAAPALI